MAGGLPSIKWFYVKFAMKKAKCLQQKNKGV